jgi:hypothetical protein
MKLYRPTGLTEICLVRDADWKAWPPRLPDQPIFYPVTTFAYAEKIARDWNSKGPAPHDIGFVTEFDIVETFAAQYPVQLAGGREHAELWVPAEDLVAFNDALIGKIAVVAAYQDGVPISLDAGLARLR